MATKTSTQMPTGPEIRRHLDGSIHFDFYRTKARRERRQQRRAVWKWLSGTMRTAVTGCRRGLCFDRPIDIVTRLR